MNSVPFLRNFSAFTIAVLTQILLPLSTQLQRWNIEYKAKNVCPGQTFDGDSKSAWRFGRISIDHARS